MPDIIDHSEPKALPPPSRRPRLSRGVIAAASLIGVLAAGAALGASGSRIIERWQPRSVMLLQPMPISEMKAGTAIAIKGEVAEVFGNKFVLQDGTGRALIDTGPRGERREIAAKGESLTIQGRFERGIVHAEVLARDDGRNEAFGPPGPPPGEHGPKGPKGLKDGQGPRAEAPPPGPAEGPAAREPQPIAASPLPNPPPEPAPAR